MRASFVPIRSILLAAAEAACGRILAAYVTMTERQKAAFYRGLIRFLQVVQDGLAKTATSDGAVAYAPPTPEQVGPALADIEAAVALEGPLRAEVVTLRVTINQTIGNHADVQADLDRVEKIASHHAAPLVQRALEHERAGEVAAALAALDRAIESDPAAGTALSARGELLRPTA